jgi:phytoene dehydrogenase-like protein
LLALPCLGGCGRDHARELEETRKAVDSWEGTLGIVVDQWRHGHVPSTYVAQIAKAADRSLAKEGKSLQTVPDDTPHRREVGERLSRLRERVRRVSAAADRSDPAAAGNAVLGAGTGVRTGGGRPS